MEIDLDLDIDIDFNNEELQQLRDLQSFLNSGDKKNKSNSIEMTKTALNLLKTLPVSKEAIFEYFCTVFDNAALHYIEGLETEIKTGKLPPFPEVDELVVSEIHSVLTYLILENPTSWAPDISTWSLELLGEISTKYAQRGHFSTNLNEILQLWMGCRATRTLVDVNTKCLSSLIHSDTEACISALLDTSVKHSPHFDWVVAHIGSCFPNTVITRVLSCGLKDFCLYKSYDQGADSPKLKSVVGILGHLAGSHVTDIKEAMSELFVWSFNESIEDTDDIKSQKKMAVPYLLQLVYLSSTLLSAVCINIKNILNLDVIVKSYYFTQDWCKYFGTAQEIDQILINLIMRLENSGLEVIKLLLVCINLPSIKVSGEVKIIIADKSKEILTTILQELEESVRHNNLSGIINSLSKEIDAINKMLLSENKLVSDTAGTIVCFLGHFNPTNLIKSATYLLQHARSTNQLALLMKCLNSDLLDKTIPPYNKNGGHFSIVLEQILSRNIQKFFSTNEENIDLTQMWSNLYTLLRWEKCERVCILNSRITTRALEENLTNMTSLFISEVSHVHVIADILDNMEVPISDSLSPSIQIILNLTQSTVNYFFACCKDNGTSLKIRGFKKACRMLKRLCIYSKVAKVLALRELLERALFSNDRALFGGQIVESDDTSEKILLKQNKKINKIIPLTRHSSVYNGGIIGTGKRKSICHDDLPNNAILSNTRYLIDALKACCTLPEENKYSDISLESMTLLSLLLVQFVSPDVMYNGLPWPEEEFSKVTMERDLFIRRMFAGTPLLWELLSFVAVYRPALCYCSVLIRALTATLIHQWKSMGEQSKNDDSENYRNLMDTTIKIIDVMALGQLLPPPLSSIRDVIAYLKCYEIVAILRDCIWCYMRDHIPSPALFGCDSNDIYWRDPVIARPPEIYTNTLRIIMQRNIKVLGHMYAQMFINIPKHS